MAVSVTCPICTDSFKSVDSIISTSCGHVFHGVCWTEWKMRSSSCPQCRQLYVVTHKLYMNFEENSAESKNQTEKLKKELEEAVVQTSILEKQVEDSERDFLKIQEQFSKTDEEMNELKKKIEYLTLQNDCQRTDVDKKSNEIFRSQEALNNSNKDGTFVKLQEEIKILNVKLNSVSQELTKEIHNSLQLTNDKTRLQFMLDHANKTLEQQIKRSQIKPIGNSNIDKKDNKLNGGCIKSLVFKNVIGTFEEEEDLMNYVLNLMKIMDIRITKDDIEHVSILGRAENQKITLLMKLASVNLKAMIMSNKKKLKFKEESKNILVLEYVSDYTNSLFHEANLLKRHGYKHVYCKNNRVFVRKNDHSQNFVISNKKDIEDLVNKNEETIWVRNNDEWKQFRLPNF